MRLRGRGGCLRSVGLGLGGGVDTVRGLRSRASFVGRGSDVVNLVSSVLFVPTFLVAACSLCTRRRVFVSGGVSFVVGLGMLGFDLVFGKVISVMLYYFAAAHRFLAGLKRCQLFRSCVVAVIPTLVAIFVQSR